MVLAAAPAGAQIRPGAADRAKELNQQAQNPDNQNNAQTNAAANPAAQVAPSAPAAHVIQHIVVRGTQRVEPGTVLTYVGLREGDNFTPADADTALYALMVIALWGSVGGSTCGAGVRMVFPSGASRTGSRSSRAPTVTSNTPLDGRP